MRAAWPPEVPPPGAAGFATAAVAWMLDAGPAEWRSYPLLRRHPLLLARWLEQYLTGALGTLTAGLRTARVELGPLLPPAVVEEAIGCYTRELERLATLRGAAALLGGALARGDAPGRGRS